MSTDLTWGEKLEDLRKERNMTLAEAAERSGLSASLISKYENGVCKITAKSLCKLLPVYGITVDKFYGIKWSDYDKDLRVFQRYGFSEKFFQEFVLFEKYGEQQISKCLNLLFDLSDTSLSAVSVFDSILQAFDLTYHEEFARLSIKPPHYAFMRCLLEPVIQALTLIFETKYPKFSDENMP